MFPILKANQIIAKNGNYLSKITAKNGNIWTRLVLLIWMLKVAKNGKKKKTVEPFLATEHT